MGLAMMPPAAHCPLGTGRLPWCNGGANNTLKSRSRASCLRFGPRRATLFTFALAASTSSSTDSKLQAAAKVLDSRLRASVIAEADEQLAQVERTYSKASEKTLVREGVALLGLQGHAEGRLYGDIIWSLSVGGPLSSLELPQHRFKSGNSVSLVAIRGNKKLRSVDATVLEVQRTCLRLAITPQAVAQLAECQQAGEGGGGGDHQILYRIEMGAQDVTSRRQLAALDQLGFLLSESRGERIVRAILLGSPKRVELSGEPPEWMRQRGWQTDAKTALQDLDDVNDSQKSAIAAALVRSVTLWQGPPGTGKTRTVLEFLALLCRLVGRSVQRRQQVGVLLAVADTNAAADNLLEGLIDRGIAVVRVGQPAKVRPELRNSCLDAIAERSPLGKKAAILRDQAAEMMVRNEQALLMGKFGERDAYEAQREVQKTWAQADAQLKEAVNDVLNRCQVVVSTLAAAGEPRLAEREFRVVVVDEATQATEPSTLIALVKGAECVIMAGDHKQLPPTVISNKAMELGMDVPLFARLQKAGMPALLLNRQYRMHPAIAAFSSARFYEGKVQSGVSAAQRPATQGFQWSNPDFPVEFVSCNAREDRARVGPLAGVQIEGSGSSFSNRSQAELAVEIVKSLLKNPSFVESCVILTPYNGQVRLLTALCTPLFKTALEEGKLIISSIDGFQGREADVVVLSTVRCNTEGKIGFVSDPRRMNVALTRARRGVVVIGCEHTLAAGSNDWRDWLAWVHSRAAV